MSNESGRDIQSIYFATAQSLLAGTGTRGAGAIEFPDRPGMETSIESIPDISGQFRTELVQALESQDEGSRSLSSSQLLAKALTDLQMGAQLLSGGQTRSPVATGVQGLDRAVLEECLIILNPVTADSDRLTRRYMMLVDLDGARRRLKIAVSDSLKSVIRNAEQVVRGSITGLLGLSLLEVMAAVSEIAGGFSTLTTSIRGMNRSARSGVQLLAESAHSVGSLVEQPMLESVTRQVLGWLEEVRGGRIVSALLEKTYETEVTDRNLNMLIDSSVEPLEPFSQALRALEELCEDHSRQSRISGQILQGARWIGGGLTAVFPQASLIMAILYLTIGGYGILSGADYVDAPRFKLLKRTRGVRLRVEEHITRQ
ncbi:MAG TPA: hypothetical protein VKZ59_16325 [Acidobacteriota bacterium]|nr:hypothetical protein [Acidobacteriota bacterium]